MYPKLFTIPAFDLFGRTLGPISLPTYGALLAVAFVIGLWIANREAKRLGLDAARVLDMAVYVLIGGLIGAKLALLIVEWPYFSKNPRELLAILQSGGVFYGGLLGALPVAWWYARRHGLPGWQTADVLAPGVAIGQAIGRLGCFAAGCCYGRPVEPPGLRCEQAPWWAVCFRDPQAMRAVGTPLDVPLFPTQLMESATVFLVFLVVLWLARRKRFEGQVTLVYLLLYAVARFAIEFYRGDAARGTVLGLVSTSQFIAALMVVAVALVYPYLARRRRPEPAAA